MAYGSVLADVVQGSTANTPPQFNDGNGVQVGTLCRAWVRFNGVTTATINASFNVSSVTRNGTGDYTINFTNALPDANYAVACANGSGAGNTVGSTAFFNGGAPTTTSIRMATWNAATNLTDYAYISAAFFR